MGKLIELVLKTFIILAFGRLFLEIYLNGSYADFTVSSTALLFVIVGGLIYAVFR